MSDIKWIDRGWQPAHIGFCPSKKAWKAQMKRMGLNEPYPESQGCTTRIKSLRDTHIIVTLNGVANRSELEIAGLIVHEATHVFDYVCEAMGEDDPSSEFKAYAIQSIFQNLSEQYLASNTTP